MQATILALTSGILVGFSLGLTGSGGSLFAIPLLLFIVGMEMADAVPISMLVVGATALLGAIAAIRSKLLLARPTLIFGIAGIFATPIGLTLGEIAPESLRIFSFAALAQVGSAFTLPTTTTTTTTTTVTRPPPTIIHAMIFPVVVIILIMP
ncbi:MAG: TSUP family transporter [Candidatus Competibacteraceae bacterium]|nr:TSUP family transporter [Candidatus Competibacteraceae bacterium]